MISVAQALDHLFALAPTLGVEDVPLAEASGRVLARPLTARLTQPPFPASAMDGYAVCAADVAIGASLTVIGESAAGHGFSGHVTAGQAVRIFTGAPVPDGADKVVLQEDVTRTGDHITLGPDIGPGDNIRPAGADFAEGTPFAAPHLLRPADIALLASMNHATVPVYRQPEVAIIATGDELVQPGETPGPDQIIASNALGLAALLREHGARPRLLPIARDTESALRLTFEMAQGADLIVTIGGASVGDHDLVGKVASDLGMDRAFYKIAMRPGKPLMAGTLNGAMMVGLPGNPVSSLVCGHVFLRPVIRAMQGLPRAALARQIAPLGRDIAANGPREHYMRARLVDGQVIPFDRQDSALLTVLATADCLLVRPPHDPQQVAGTHVSIIRL
ncbi:MAG: molybdopterin molybdotransferase MoeA [Marivivens sp.]|nr:molybdopterin molybdotransferase MoeA [Marivivens sp.]